MDELARLHAEGRAVDDLAVDEDVAVHDELAGLRDGAGEAGAEHEGVEAHLEQLDQVLTGQAVGAAGLVERDAELLLADAVLGAQTLLLAQTHGVVASPACAWCGRAHRERTDASPCTWRPSG